MASQESLLALGHDKLVEFATSKGVDPTKFESDEQLAQGVSGIVTPEDVEKFQAEHSADGDGEVTTDAPNTEGTDEATPEGEAEANANAHAHTEEVKTEAETVDLPPAPETTDGTDGDAGKNTETDTPSDEDDTQEPQDDPQDAQSDPSDNQGEVKVEANTEPQNTSHEVLKNVLVTYNSFFPSRNRTVRAQNEMRRTWPELFKVLEQASGRNGDRVELFDENWHNFDQESGATNKNPDEITIKSVPGEAVAATPAPTETTGELSEAEKARNLSSKTFNQGEAEKDVKTTPRHVAVPGEGDVPVGPVQGDPKEGEGKPTKQKMVKTPKVTQAEKRIAEDEKAIEQGEKDFEARKNAVIEGDNEPQVQ